MKRGLFYGLLGVSFVLTFALLPLTEPIEFVIAFLAWFVIFALGASTTRYLQWKNKPVRVLLTLVGLAATAFYLYLIISLADSRHPSNYLFNTWYVGPIIGGWLLGAALVTFLLGQLGLWWIHFAKGRMNPAVYLTKHKTATIIVSAIIVFAIIFAGIKIWANYQEYQVHKQNIQNNSNIRGYQCADGFDPFKSSQENIEKFCRSFDYLEYRAVIDILNREDVRRVIEKYDTVEAWVRALGHKYIHDDAYLDRILPAYADMKIDCIIVVHSPEGTRFFIENGEVHKSHDDHQYIELPASEFLGSLNAASDEDVTAFWVALH